jgi:hypothetical protein
MKKLENPFQFGDPVEGDYYVERPELARTARQFLENRIHVVLIGPRRFGKTSFVLNLLEELQKEEFSCLFLDIFNITSLKDFLQQLMRALKAKKSWLKEFLESVSKLRPKLTAEIDPLTGHHAFGFAVEPTSEEDIKETIQDVLEGLEKLGKRVIVTIDEFQKITEIADQGWLEATLRTSMQQLKNTSFLFTGSRKSIIYDMLNNPAKPLYRSCQMIEFPTLGEEFTDWVLKRFARVGITCERDAIVALRERVQQTPHYVQMVCFHLVTEGLSHITIKDMEKTLATVVRQNSYAYQTLLNSLTLMQQRVLRLAANEGKNLFSKELLEKYEITSAPALASALKALKDKGILDESVTRGTVTFDDPLLALWLQLAFMG